MRQPLKEPLLVVSAEPEVIDLLQQSSAYRLVGVVDKNPRANISGLKYLGGDEAGKLLLKKNKDWRVVLALDPPNRKEKLTHFFGVSKLKTIQAKNSLVAQSARLGQGCIVQQGVKIMPRARIGIGCKLNMDVAVHHDCIVGDFCTLAPGSRLLGAAHLDNNVFIGAGAIVLPHVKIGRSAVIGAGAVVVKNVPPSTVVAGVPACPLKRGARG